MFWYRFIDPGCLWQGHWFWHFPLKPLRMFYKSIIQNSLTLFDNLFSPSVMDIFGREESDSGMVMLSIVPAEKVPAKCPAVFGTPEPFWKLRPVFHGFELGLRIGIVIAYIRPGKTFSDPQISQQESNRF